MLKRKLSAWAYPEEIQLAEQFAYGHREVLLATSELDPSSLFRASLPHGWGPDVPGRPYPKVYKRLVGEYPILAWSSRAAKDLIVRGYKSTITIGSPWAHLLTKLDLASISKTHSSATPNTNAVLYFPSHSIPGGHHDHNFKLQSVLNGLSPTKFTVCLFWLDFVNPRIRNYYSQFNCEIFCVGFKGSTGFDIPWAPVGGREMFIPTLLDLLERHDSIIFETVSTPFWYAASLKKNIYISDLKVSSTWWGNSESIDMSINNIALLELVNPELGKLKMNELIQTSDLLYDCAKRELGFEHVDTFNEKIDRFKLLKSGVIVGNLVDPITKYIQLKSHNI